LSKHPELKELEELLPWYRYLFLGKSKPSTHIQALSEIKKSGEKEQKNLHREKMPPVLARLLEHTNKKINVDKTI
jgi:hypothetical protein